MVGVPPAASGVINRKLLAQQFGTVCTGAAGVQRWVFKQPYKLSRAGVAYCSLQRFHTRHRVWVRRQAFGNVPVDIAIQNHVAAFSMAQAACHRICLSLRPSYADEQNAKEA